MIAALKRLRVSMPRTTALIVGSGPDRVRLEAFAREQDLGSGVRFLGSVADPRPALSLMCVFVFLPVEKEGFGLTLLEAMAAGCPVVAMRCSGGSGWLLDQIPDDLIAVACSVDELAEKIQGILKEPERALRVSQRAQAWVSERFGLRNMAEGVLSLYAEVLGTSRARA